MDGYINYSHFVADENITGLYWSTSVPLGLYSGKTGRLRERFVPCGQKDEAETQDHAALDRITEQ